MLSGLAAPRSTSHAPSLHTEQLKTKEVTQYNQISQKSYNQISQNREDVNISQDVAKDQMNS